jgi:hypothetical protein
MNAQIKVRLTAKRCTCCREMKPAGEFYAHVETRDRLTSWCKSCTKQRAAQSKREHGYHQTELTPAQRAKWAEIARQNAAETGP